ncbi:O-acyltransferase like protein [Culex quinquefasciatus]|uniref:O-acyltransferase like protein n=1 Tax=Culex quinquefasciatus TaxID=7176 RepID=UPI0018E36ED8|nr:O-acyltransferase like protein [Culex quinquefasciatus]
MPSPYRKVVFCISITLCVLAVQCSVVDADWNSANVKRKLPKLFEYDDFDECRAANPNFQYCVVQAVIQPDDSSDIWRNISIISSDSRNFPRDHLERGICLHECLLPAGEDLLLGPNISRDDQRLAHQLDRCVNKALRRSHDLYASTSILHCLSEEDFGRPLSTGELAFLALVTVLVLVIGRATLWEVPETGTVYHSLIAPFCLSRNVNQLLTVVTTPNDSATTGGSLECLEGLRAIFMLIILVVHSSLPIIRMPLKNPDEMELQTNSFIFPFANSGNTHMITFFFAIGGMVQVVSFLSSMQRSPEQAGVGFFRRKVLHRLARLLPAYLFMIFYQATLFPRTKPTPIAHKFTDYCDRHWWSNVAFINNFVHLDEPCLKFGWYLGADFQLFLIGLAIMMFMWRFPRAKSICVGLMVSVALVVPAYVIYTEKLDATMGFHMRHALTELRTYNEFLKYYTLTSVNAGTYFFGMIAGLLYHHISKHNLQQSARHYTPKLFRLVLVAFLSLNGFLTLLPSLPLTKPSLFLAIFGSALRAIWGITHATLFLLFVFKAKSIAVAFLEHPILRVLARLSYSVYVVQYSVIYMIYSNLSVPFAYGAFNSAFVTSAIMFITFISGLLLHVAVELPCGSILKQIIDGKLSFSMPNSLRLKRS